MSSVTSRSLVQLETTPKPATVALPKESRSYVHFVAGGVGGLAGAICTSPLDVVKTRLQSTFYQQTRMRPNGFQTHFIVGHFLETARLLARIKQVEGVRGYFKGLGPNLIGVIPARSINFFTYGNGKKIYTELNDGKETAGVHLISAATAGICTATATNPIWVVKTRLQLQGNGQQQYRNSLDCILSILRGEGIRGLYKGMSASYLGVVEGTLQWVIYEDLKKKWAVPKSNISQERTIGGKSLRDWTGNVGAAAISKFVAACVSYPHEVIRTRLRQPAENGVLKYTGLWQCLRVVLREEGIVALYGGMTAHLMRVVPNAAIMFFCYEAIVHHFGEQQHQQMAPGALNPQSSVVADANELKDLQSWLKEVEGAESLMTELEAKAESLEAKVDALLADMERIEQEKSSNGSIETEEKSS